jgi:hypothetical protein
MCKLWFRPFFPIAVRPNVTVNTGMCPNDSYVSHDIMFTFWFMVYINAFVRFDPRGNSQGRSESLISIVVITRYHHHAPKPPSNVATRTIKTSTLCWTESTTSRSSASLPRNLLTGTRQEGVVRYDHVDAVRRISQFTANLTWTRKYRWLKDVQQIPRHTLVYGVQEGEQACLPFLVYTRSTVRANHGCLGAMQNDPSAIR